MTSRVLLILALCGLACASLELRTVQEEVDRLEPGESSGTYAIVDGGRVVGMVQRISSSRASMGRRGGPSDDALPPHGERMASMMRARIDLVGALQDHLLGSGCPFARQMALARMQATAAAAAQGMLLSGHNPHQHQHRLGLSNSDAVDSKLFGEPEPWNGEEEHPPAGDRRGPHVMMLMRRHSNDQLVGPGPFKTEEEREAYRQAHPAFPRPGMLREPASGELPDPSDHPAFPHPMMWRSVDSVEEGEQVDRFDPLGHPAFPRPLLLRDGSEREWQSLDNTAMPAPGFEPEVDWRVRDEDGNLNWGLVTFGVLSGACAAVWGAMMIQYCWYCSARAACSGSRCCFMSCSRSGPDGPLKPLLHEGHLEDLDSDLDSPKTSVKEGVEYAAAHVPAATRNVTILHYEALPASQK